MEKIDIDKIFKAKNPILYKWLPGFVISYVKRVVHQDDVNSFIEKHGHKKNFEFAKAIIETWHINVMVKGIENIPQSHGCIVAANHPLGGLDAMALITALESKRTDLRFLVNDILLNIKNLEQLFVGINKHGKNSKEMLDAIDNLYSSDSCIVVYPAGLVSRKKGSEVKDLEWKKSFVTKAKKYQKDVIPVHISGRNSNFFYQLSNFRKMIGIKSNIEMFYLVDETFRNSGGTITITIGKPISPQQFDKSKSDSEWAQYVKDEVYKCAE